MVWSIQTRCEDIFFIFCGIWYFIKIHDMQYSSDDIGHLLTKIDSLNYNLLLSEYENQIKSKAHGFDEDALAYIRKCK